MEGRGKGNFSSQKWSWSKEPVSLSIHQIIARRSSAWHSIPYNSIAYIMNGVAVILLGSSNAARVKQLHKVDPLAAMSVDLDFDLIVTSRADLISLMMMSSLH